MTQPGNTDYLLTMGESLLALALIIAILLAVADTPLYPAAFGAVAIAGLYVVINSKDPYQLSHWAKWASGKLA